MNPIISFKNVNFSYVEGTPVLNDVSFDIYKNEYVCIIGHNGSGKSTISKVLTGLLKPQYGEVSILDQVISTDTIKDIRNNIGIVFQNPDNQFIGLTVEDDIAFGLENRRYPSKVIRQTINTVAKITNIQSLIKKEPNQLSGGQKQRVAIASVLAINPEIILFDESTSMLDPKGKEELKDIILELRNKAKKTVISITHDMEEVIRADRVIVMEKGVVVANDKPEKIFTDANKMQQLKLDFPYTLKLSYLLNEHFSNIPKTFNAKELVDSICNIKKK